MVGFEPGIIHNTDPYRSGIHNSTVCYTNALVLLLFFMLRSLPPPPPHPFCRAPKQDPPDQALEINPIIS